MSDPTMSTDDRSSSPFRSPVWIASAAVVVLLVGAAVLLAVREPAGDATSAPARTSSIAAAPATPVDDTDVVDGACNLPTDDDQVPLTAPAADWELVGTTAAPYATEVGPAVVDDDGIRSCYARTATGALFAAAGFMAAVTDVDRIVPAVSQLTAEGPGRDAILALLEADPTAVTGTGTRYQIAGYLFTGYTADLAQVTIAIGTTGGYVAVPLNLQWTDGTWLVLVPPSGDITAQAQGIGSLTSFTEWAGA